MADFFRCAGFRQDVLRRVEGLSLFGLGTYVQQYNVSIPATYNGQAAAWGVSISECLPLSLAILTSCLDGIERLNSGDVAANDTALHFHEQFAEEVICRLDSTSPLELDWYVAQSWIDQHAFCELGRATRSVQRIREFERLLTAALSEGDPSRFHHIPTQVWTHWDIETLVNLCVVTERLQSESLTRFVDHLLDIKFKLYCLLEVDVPAYASAVEKWGLDFNDPGSTPQGFAVRLSEEVTIVIKSRAVWESVMNAVYRYETGREAPTVKVVDESDEKFSSKTAKFFPWVQDQPLWSSLNTFKSLVEALEKLRMSEVHRLSRVRGNFTNLVLQPIENCLDLLNCILRYVFDHMVAAIALRSAASYDAPSRSTIAVGVL